MRPRLILTVGLISAGTLSFEILLVRVFAIQHFHHFAYMAIGVAMLGFGASGTLVALIGHIRRDVAVKLVSWCSVATAASLILGPAFALRLTLDPTRLVWDVGQWYRLAAVYCAFAVPFGSGAMVVLLAIALETRRPGLLYGASFAGSGLGVAAAMASLWFAAPERALALPGLLAAGGGIVATLVRSDPGASEGSGTGARVAAAAVAILATLSLAHPPWSVTVSPYKELPQVEAYPGARRLAERSSPVGWLVAIATPAFRYAPGLSLGFDGSLPQQIGLFVDGQVSGAIGTMEGGGAVLDWLPTAAPYSVGDPHDVLVLGAGGGTEILNAMAHGASHVTGVELHAGIVELAQTLSEAGTFPPTIEWVVGDARRFAARTSNRYDLITIPPTGALGASAAGLHSLNEDFLHTTDAYESYLRLLRDDGMLAITCWLTVPPRKSTRIVLTAADALLHLDGGSAARRLAVMRSWGTATVLAKPAGFTSDEIQSLSDWTSRRLFDLDWYPGLEAPQSEFHHLEEPVLFSAARAASAGHAAATEFAASYPFDVSPVSDSRPYPSHFLRLGSLGGLLGSSRRSVLPFAEWGQVALMATLVQSVVLATLLMLVPAALKGRRDKGPAWLALVGYFSAIGFAYLAAEIAAIQQLGLLLGHPVYAVATVLAAFLVSSGIGSMLSDRLACTRAPLVAVAITAWLAVFAAWMLQLVHGVQGASLPVRAAVAVAALGPLALLMGVPFPLGLRALAGDNQRQIAWAWAANGFASATGAPLAALLALELGSPALFGTAAAAYGIAAGLAAIPKMRR